MKISAEFTVNGAANPAAHTVGYGGTVNLALVQLAGVRLVTVEIQSTSKASQAKPALTIGGSPYGATASFTMPADPGDGLGRAFRIKYTVQGVRETATSYAVVGAVNTAGRIPLCAGEDNDRNATHGWTETFNLALAETGGGGGLDPADDLTIVGNDSGGTATPIPIPQETLRWVRDDFSEQAVGFKTLAQLRTHLTTYGVTEGRIYRVAHHTTVGDDGGGTFRGKVGSGPYVDDDGDTINATGIGTSAANGLTRIGGRRTAREYGLSTAKTAAQNYAAAVRLAARAAALAATLGAATIELPHSEEYEVDETIELPSNLLIKGVKGAGFTNTGTNRSVLRAYEKDNITLDGLTIRGNNTGTGGSGASDGTGGHGVVTYYSDNITIRNCEFHNIGAGTSGAPNNIAIRFGTGVISDGNYFAPTCLTVTGSDHNFASAVSRTIITNCVSESGMDTFCTTATGQPSDDGETNSYHIVDANIATRLENGSASDMRHAVSMNYNYVVTRTIISDNIFENFSWTCCYATGDFTDPAPPAAGYGEIIITGNMMRYIGGANPIAGAIIITSLNVVIANNYIYRPGHRKEFYLDASGGSATRANNAPCIKVRESENVAISSNVLVEPTGYCIHFDPTYNSIRSVQANDNVMRNPMTGFIHFQARADRTVEDVDITDNVGVSDVANCNGFDINISATQTFRRVRIRGNYLKGALGGTAYGICLQDGPRAECEITDNKLDGWDQAIRCLGATAARAFPDVMLLARNTTANCTTAYHLKTGGGNVDQIVLDPIIINCGSIGTTCYVGRSNGYNSSMQMLVEFIATADPTGGTWRAGDRYWNPSTIRHRVYDGAAWRNPKVVLESYATGSRPTAVAGQTVFDSTLGHSITYDGANWKNGIGATV